VVESTPDQLVLMIPPGGDQSRSQAKFLNWWVVGLVLLTGTWLAGWWPGPAGQDDSPWVAPVVLLGFWIVTAFFAYDAILSRFELVSLRVTRDQCLLHTRIWGRSRSQPYEVRPDDWAGLMSEEPGSEQTVIIGTRSQGLQLPSRFSPAETRWLIARINDVLHGPEESRTLRGTEPGLGPESTADPVAEQSSGGSPLRIIEDTSDQLVVFYHHIQTSWIRWGLTAVAVGLVAMKLKETWLDRQEWVLQWVGLRGVMLFALGGATLFWLLVLAGCVGYVWRRTLVTLTRSQLVLRKGFGWCSINREVPTGDIRQIVLSRRRITPQARDLAVTHPNADHDDSSHCLVETSHGRLRVVEEGSRALAGQMAAALVQKLSEWGLPSACHEEWR
jgi:hypothetical protein